MLLLSSLRDGYREAAIAGKRLGKGTQGVTLSLPKREDLALKVRSYRRTERGALLAAPTAEIARYHLHKCINVLTGGWVYGIGPLDNSVIRGRMVRVHQASRFDGASVSLIERLHGAPLAAVTGDELALALKYKKFGVTLDLRGHNSFVLESTSEEFIGRSYVFLQVLSDSVHPEIVRSLNEVRSDSAKKGVIDSLAYLHFWRHLSERFLLPTNNPMSTFSWTDQDSWLEFGGQADDCRKFCDALDVRRSHFEAYPSCYKLANSPGSSEKALKRFVASNFSFRERLLAGISKFCSGEFSLGRELRHQPPEGTNFVVEKDLLNTKLPVSIEGGEYRIGAFKAE